MRTARRKASRGNWALSRTAVTYRTARAVDGIRNTPAEARCDRGCSVCWPACLAATWRPRPAPQTFTQSLAKLALAGATVVPPAGLLGWIAFGGLGIKQVVVLAGLLLVLAMVGAWKTLPATHEFPCPDSGHTRQSTFGSPARRTRIGTAPNDGGTSASGRAGR